MLTLKPYVKIPQYCTYGTIAIWTKLIEIGVSRESHVYCMYQISTKTDQNPTSDNERKISAYTAICINSLWHKFSVQVASGILCI
jgi:hypothetical protein